MQRKMFIQARDTIRNKAIIKKEKKMQLAIVINVTTRGGNKNIFV